MKPAGTVERPKGKLSESQEAAIENWIEMKEAASKISDIFQIGYWDTFEHGLLTDVVVMLAVPESSEDAVQIVRSRLSEVSDELKISFANINREEIRRVKEIHDLPLDVETGVKNRMEQMGFSVREVRGKVVRIKDRSQALIVFYISFFVYYGVDGMVRFLQTTAEVIERTGLTEFVMT